MSQRDSCPPPHSFDVFGRLSKGHLLMLDAFQWAPRGFATWVFERDKRPGMVKLRENKTYAHEVAAKLIEEKRQDLKNGTSRRDVLSLLGSYCASFCSSIHEWYNGKLFSQGKFFHAARLETGR